MRLNRIIKSQSLFLALSIVLYSIGCTTNQAHQSPKRRASLQNISALTNSEYFHKNWIQKGLPPSFKLGAHTSSIKGSGILSKEDPRKSVVRSTFASTSSAKKAPMSPQLKALYNSMKVGKRSITVSGKGVLSIAK